MSRNSEFMAAICAVCAITYAIAAHISTNAQAEPPPPPIPPPAPPPTAELERRLNELERQLHEARVLAAFGGARMRGPKVLRVISCDASFMPGSYGADAYSALRRTGLCDAPERLPGKEAHR